MRPRRSRAICISPGPRRISRRFIADEAQFQNYCFVDEIPTNAQEQGLASTARTTHSRLDFLQLATKLPDTLGRLPCFPSQRGKVCLKETILGHF
jgi:hypothetical protein